MKKRKNLLTCAGLAVLGLLACCAFGLISGMLSPENRPAIPAEQLPLPTERATAAPPTPTETALPAATETSLPTFTPEAIMPTTASNCECSFDKYNCDDPEAVTCFRYCLEAGAGDVHKLDGDGDGVACENN